MQVDVSGCEVSLGHALSPAALHHAQVDVGSVDTAKFDDAYFKPTEKKEKKKGEAEFFQVRVILDSCGRREFAGASSGLQRTRTANHSKPHQAMLAVGQRDSSSRTAER